VFFKPAGVPLRLLETQTLTVDEVEALRLADGEGLDQQAAAEQMGVSRATVGRILERARRKTATALTRGQALAIEAESEAVRFYEPPAGHGCGGRGRRRHGGGACRGRGR
jgi:predicted DNA-binding protein (UPF0251 family)